MQMQHRAYKYRIYPTSQQIDMLTRWQAACWEVQRLCIVQRRVAWNKYRYLYSGQKAERPLPGWASQGREMTQLRADDPFLADVPADTMRDIVKRVDRAYTKMRADMKAGKRAKVRWADKAAHVGLTFRGQERGTHVVGLNGRHAYIKLAGAGKLGTLKTRYHRPLADGATILQAHITHAADGWYISLTCEELDQPPAPPAPLDLIGVDLNVKHEGDVQAVAALSDGRVYRQTSGLKRNAKRLATLQKLVSKDRHTRGTAKAADPKSKRTAKRRARIAKLHQRIARQREHTQQYIARRLVDTADTIAFEKLNLTGMRRKGKGRRKRGLNKAQSTAAPGALIALTKLKAAQDGRTVVQVDPRNTTQACSECGVIGERKGLNVRRWTCAACGADHDRDSNAARNIAARARNGRTPAFSGGVPGEGAAGKASEQPSVNLEATPVAGSEQRGRLSLPQTDTVRNSPGKRRIKRVSGQLSLFDDI